MRQDKDSGFFDGIKDNRIRELAFETYNELAKCRLCPLDCGADRIAGERGDCGASLYGEVFYAGLLFNEERDLNPAYEVFFTGCNLSCKFCYLKHKVRARHVMGPVWAAPLRGHRLYSDSGLAHAKSLSAVGGEPVVNLLAALYLFGTAPIRPRVWNSNMMYSGFVADVVGEVADVVVADIHFGNDLCASRISGATEYMSSVMENILKSRKARKEVILRHLMLPGHVECCALSVIRLVAEKFSLTKVPSARELPSTGSRRCG